MDLAVRTERRSTVLFVFEARAKDEFTGAVNGGDARGCRHVVDPHYHEMEKSNENLLWQSLVG